MRRNSLQVVHPFHEKGKPATSRSFAVKPAREQKRSLKWKNSKSKCKTQQEENLLKTIKYNDPTSWAKIPFFASCQRLIRVLGGIIVSCFCSQTFTSASTIGHCLEQPGGSSVHTDDGLRLYKTYTTAGGRGMFLFFFLDIANWWEMVVNLF